MCREKYAPQVDRAVFPGMQGGPHDHINAAKAVALGEALKPEFKVYARQIITNAKVMAEELANKDYKIISGGTDNHLLVIDMTNKGVAGKETEILLDKVGISVSRSTIPNDPNPPMNPSGVRLGTPAITTRGMREKDVIKIVSLFDKTIISKNKAAELNKIKKEVKEFCLRFPVPGI